MCAASSASASSSSAAASSPPAGRPSASSPPACTADRLYALAAAHHPPRRCTVVDRSDSRPPDQEIRKNGLARPLQAFQILSWVCFGGDILLFYLLLIPSVSMAVQISVGLLFGLCALTVFACGWVATTLDPIDPIAFESGPYSLKPAPEVHPDMRECDVCGYVNERSKHCRVCNKCVDGFDHHCMWINNCVGDRNYKPFFALLVATALMTVLVVVVAVWCVVEEAVWGHAAPRWRDAYGWFEPVAYYCLVALPIALNVPLFALVGQLLALHIYLVRHHLTTFEYITLRVHEEQADQALETAGRPPSAKQKKHRAWAEWIVIDRRRLKKARKRGTLMRDISEISQCTPVGHPGLRHDDHDDGHELCGVYTAEGANNAPDSLLIDSPKKEHTSQVARAEGSSPAVGAEPSAVASPVPAAPSPALDDDGAPAGRMGSSGEKPAAQAA
ncbi:DHHC zinc finger domain-containing protein [Besnoitia besnoiti]|uniref:Palmitoyltransferase n=1 Tax=Besnoitia besnoiti TaxID=94643 RepID=A0A2A9MQ65_BESBE|nr:DHHC zinc finger domain-containing protein [Besnoitia besnoiti]PFH38082.1 DHHC zinc finger domain-containing protein [Besnoitia besnoiti]